MNALLIIDLAFGDCGKGALVDHLTRRHRAHTIIRFNGGPQAGHNVITPDGRHHTFSQFASGSFVPGVRTLLSRFMLIEPYAMLNESAHLATMGVGDALPRLMIDARAPVITPLHQAANRLRELARGDAAHGTCGMGIGETMQDLLDRPELMIRAAELSDRFTLRRKLLTIRDYKAAQLDEIITATRDNPAAGANLDVFTNPAWIDTAIDHYAHIARSATILEDRAVRDILQQPGTIIFEAAQGVLLDEWFGFHPHTTWSTTTFANADALLDESGHDPASRTRIGILRSYFTRHGAGPFVSEDPAMRLPEPHNADAGWQGRFRIGPFDAVAARYTLAVAGRVDELAITHLDRLPRLPPRICTAYRLDHPPADVDRFFTTRAGQIHDIHHHRPADLPHQERLTGLLRRCRPELTPIDTTSPDRFLHQLETALAGPPIRLIATGPTAEDWSHRPSHVQPPRHRLSSSPIA